MGFKLPPKVPQNTLVGVAIFVNQDKVKAANARLENVPSEDLYVNMRDEGRAGDEEKDRSRRAAIALDAVSHLFVEPPPEEPTIVLQDSERKPVTERVSLAEDLTLVVRSFTKTVAYDVMLFQMKAGKASKLDSIQVGPHSPLVHPLLLPLFPCYLVARWSCPDMRSAVTPAGQVKHGMHAGRLADMRLVGSPAPEIRTRGQQTLFPYEVRVRPPEEGLYQLVVGKQKVDFRCALGN